MPNYTIHIDEFSGFCWGVVKTVNTVEKQLKEKSKDNLYILGEIIHNPKEIERLENEGLQTISLNEMGTIDPDNSLVVIRAHGEPPSTYEKADSLKIELVDATCPLVKALQHQLVKYYNQGYQTVIYGKRDHAEVIGLRGVCNDDCIVVKSPDEAVEKVNFDKKVILLSQTTMDKPTFDKIAQALEKKAQELNKTRTENNKAEFRHRNTICKYVSDREDNLTKFSKQHDIIIFVAGKNSSNGKSLYHICLNANIHTYFIENYEEIDFNWFKNSPKIGITGATSTPQWYLQYIKEQLESNLN